MSDERMHQLSEKVARGEATGGEKAEAWLRIVGGILAGILLIVVCGFILYACASML